MAVEQAVSQGADREVVTLADVASTVVRILDELAWIARTSSRVSVGLNFRVGERVNGPDLGDTLNRIIGTMVEQKRFTSGSAQVHVRSLICESSVKITLRVEA